MVGNLMSPQPNVQPINPICVFPSTNNGPPLSPYEYERYLRKLYLVFLNELAYVTNVLISYGAQELNSGFRQKLSNRFFANFLI